jgi:hypothetical protein
VSCDVPSGAPSYELCGDTPERYTPVVDPAAVFRRRLLYAARGEYGRLTTAGRLLQQHGDEARHALWAAGPDWGVDELLERAGVPFVREPGML